MTVNKFLRKFPKNKHLIMIILAIIVGVFAGFGAIAIRFLIKNATTLFFGTYDNFLEMIGHISAYRKVLVPAIGGLIVGPIIYFFAKEAKGHGVPEVMTANLLRGGKIRKRVAFVKAIASAITIGSGGSVGREGPIVQIGSSLGSTIGQMFGLNDKDVATLVGCGAAGGIAAAFNAPIAGALFALEIILGDFAVASLSPIIISSVIATLVSTHIGGNHIEFLVPAYQMNSNLELIPYTFLGIASGLAAVLFIVVLYYMEDKFDNWKFPDYLKPMVGGLILGITGIFFPQNFGVGYGSIHGALQTHWPLWILMAMIPLKIFATSVTLSSGGSGGIFAPSLYIGAATGGVVGIITNQLFPQAANPGTYALVGMGAVVAATTQAPITAIVIIFELTRNYSIIAPLMFTCIISTLIAITLKEESIYTLRLKLNGISLKEGKEEHIMQSIKIPEIMKEGIVLPESMNLRMIIDKALTSTQSVFPVVNRDNNLTGILTLNCLKSVFYEKEALADLVIAEDIATPPIYLTEEASLQDAMLLQERHTLEEFPVVASKDDLKYKGMVFNTDIVKSYNSEIKKRELALAVVAKQKYKDITEGISLGEGYRLSEISVPDEFIGKSLIDVSLRSKYQLEVILVKHPGKSDLIPNPQATFKLKDRLVVVGVLEHINKFKKDFGV